MGPQNSQKQQVIVGARTARRALQLARWLGASGHAEVLETCTRRNELLRHAARHIDAVLVVEESLEDVLVLESLYSIALKHPRPVVALTSSRSSAFILEAYRAGVALCLPWPRPSDDGEMPHLFKMALSQSLKPLKLRALPSHYSAAIPYERTGALVFLLGEQAIETLFCILAQPLDVIRSAVIGVDLFHPNIRIPFARHVAHSKSFQHFDSLEGGRLSAGFHLLTTGETQMLLHIKGSGSHQSPERQALEDFIKQSHHWLAAVSEALRRGRLEQVLMVIHGELSQSARPLVERLLSQGAAIAESTSEGYLFREAENAPSLTFSKRAFWATILRGDVESDTHPIQPLERWRQASSFEA